VAVRTEKGQVVQSVILPIAVYVLKLHWNAIGFLMPLGPSASHATFPIFPNEIPSEKALILEHGVQA
jgi:hypothetical protein